MSLDTHDASVMNSWLVAGAMTALKGASQKLPWRTTLLDQQLSLWTDADGALHGEFSGEPVLVQARYGFAWVCPSGKPAHELFAFPEFDEPGRCRKR